mgnify:CR=1 FL=1
MKNLAWVLLACILFSAVLVLADGSSVKCIDSDSEDDLEDSIGEKGSVTYGLTEKYDECVSSEGGYHLSTSRWVREYYCLNISGVIQRQHKDFDCARYGYTKCEEGRCVGKTTAANLTKAAKPAGPLCGNHQIDAGEQCDPPDKICYDSSGKIGICTRPNAQGFGGCQCKTYKGAETTPEPVQNVTVQQNTTAPPAPQPEPAQPKEEPKEEPDEEPKAEPAAPLAERAPLPVEFEDSRGISVTKGITNAVKRFFRWIGSWFD